MYLLALNPECQNKCVEELKTIFVDKDEPTSMSHINKLHYIELCVKETLRLFPSVPIIARKSNDDIPLSKYIYQFMDNLKEKKVDHDVTNS